MRAASCALNGQVREAEATGTIGLAARMAGFLSPRVPTKLSTTCLSLSVYSPTWVSPLFTVSFHQIGANHKLPSSRICDTSCRQNSTQFKTMARSRSPAVLTVVDAVEVGVGRPVVIWCIGTHSG